MSRSHKFALLLLAAVLTASFGAVSFAGKKAEHAGKLNIGRTATPKEIAGWDIDVRPDGQGLPVGQGSVKDGEALYVERCAACHGEFGESAGRWPIVAGGTGSLATYAPVKSVGSYWPYASTLIDYIRRAMPFGASQSLTNDELYAITAYVLYLNDAITDEEFVLSDKNFTGIKLPNRGNFIGDNRETSEKSFWKDDPCMKDCASSKAHVTGRARTIDVTPEADEAPKVE